MRKQLLAAGDVTIMYAQFEIVGYVGNVDEMQVVKARDNETSVLHFSVAHNPKNGNKSDDEEPLWVRVTAWGRLAEGIEPYLKSGKLVLVKGTLAYDPDTGGPRIYGSGPNKDIPAAAFEMTASEFRFLGGSKSDDDGEKPAKPVLKFQPKTPKVETETEPATPAVDGNGIPF